MVLCVVYWMQMDCNPGDFHTIQSLFSLSPLPPSFCSPPWNMNRDNKIVGHSLFLFLIERFSSKKTRKTDTDRQKTAREEKTIEEEKKRRKKRRRQSHREEGKAIEKKEKNKLIMNQQHVYVRACVCVRKMRKKPYREVGLPTHAKRGVGLVD